MKIIISEHRLVDVQHQQGHHSYQRRYPQSFISQPFNLDHAISILTIASRSGMDGCHAVCDLLKTSRSILRIAIFGWFRVSRMGNVRYWMRAT
jgi:hypothetical protein